MILSCEFFLDPFEELGLDKLPKEQIRRSLFILTVIAQISIGIYYAQQRKSHLRHSQLEKNSPPLPRKGNIVTDLIGSPQTSATSILSYYITGVVLRRERLSFVTQELYECLKNPIPHSQKNVISPLSTVIPYFYPHYENDKVQNEAYSRCHEALYKSCIALSLKQSPDSLWYEPFHSPASSEEQQYFIKKCQISLRNAEQQACWHFQVIAYLSKTSRNVGSHFLTTLQLTLPNDDALPPQQKSFDVILDLITQLKPECLVIHQKRATLKTHQRVLFFAFQIHALFRQKNLRFQLRSLAYHNDNPTESLPDLSTFYSFFSEICTMGYNNPNNAIKEASPETLSCPSNQLSQESFTETHPKTLEQKSHWDQTTIYHTNLKRPPFEWQYLYNTLTALFLHEIFFQACHSMTNSVRKAAQSKTPRDIVVALFACFGLSSTSKWLMHLSFLPIRILFTINAACYLYLSGNCNNLFDLNNRPQDENILLSDTFSRQEVREHIFIYEHNDKRPQIQLKTQELPVLVSPVKKIKTTAAIKTYSNKTQ